MARMNVLLALLVFLLAGSALADREVPVPLPPDTSPAIRHFSADIACSADQCLAVWMAVSDKSGPGTELRGIRMAPNGRLLDTGSFHIADGTFAQVVALKNDYVVIYNGLIYARVSRAGVVTTRDQKMSISSNVGSVYEAAAAGGSILLYSVENHGPLVPYVTLLDENLKVIREVKIDGQPTDIAAAGNGFVVASTTVDGIKATRLASDGTIVSTDVIPVFSASGVIAAANDSILVAWRRAQTNDAPATTEFAIIEKAGAPHVGVLDKSISMSTSLDVASTGNEYLIAWTRPTAGFYSDHVFVRRISSKGQLLDASATVVAQKGPYQLQARCEVAGTGYLATWTDTRFGGWHDHIFGATVAATGEVSSDFLVSKLVVSQSGAALATAGDIIATAWLESADDKSGAVMFARARTDGTLLDTTPIRLTDIGTKPAITSQGNNFFVAWRQWGVAKIAIIDTAGHVTSTGEFWPNATGSISVAAGPTDILVVCDYNNSIVLGRMANGVIVNANMQTIGSGSDPKIAFDGQYFWVIDRNAGTIEARRVLPDGKFIDAVPYTIGKADATNDQLAIACGKGSCAALWRAVRGDQSSIEGAALTSGGAVPGIVATRGSAVAQPALAWNGSAYIATWSAQGPGETSLNIHAAQLSASGNLLSTDSVVTASDRDESSPAISIIGTAKVFAFSRASADAGDRVYLRFDGEETPRRRSARH